jgi:hypothetical protein
LIPGTYLAKALKTRGPFIIVVVVVVVVIIIMWSFIEIEIEIFNVQAVGFS